MEWSDFYIDGEWRRPAPGHASTPVINPATEAPVALISLGAREDVDRAVAAARNAFEPFARTSVADRIALLERVIALYVERYDALARMMTLEIGAPITSSRKMQAVIALGHLKQAVKVLGSYQFETQWEGGVLRREPIGVCALITPWNWPLNQVTCKLSFALAAGCTVVLKPSEIAPLSPMLLMEILHDAGLPAGVVNLVNGTGPEVGAALAAHPDVDMVSFTGSTRAGVAIAQAAAPTVKHVVQELGGKSANILLEDAPLEKAVPSGVMRGFSNAGQACQAPTRMLVPRRLKGAVEELAVAAAARFVVGDPQDPATTMGPLANAAQFERVQAYIRTGMEEGARLLCGGPGRVDGFETGFFVKPTIFGDVDENATIAQEEIFGPVLSIIPYEDEEDAVRIANNSKYGLAGYVQSADPERARAVARRIRAGRVYINEAMPDPAFPFGGYRQSGNGREHGVFGMEEYLEVKAIL